MIESSKVTKKGKTVGKRSKQSSIEDCDFFLYNTTEDVREVLEELGYDSFYQQTKTVRNADESY